MPRIVLITTFAAIALSGASALAQKIGEVPRERPTSDAPREKTLEWSSSAERPFWYRLPKKIDAKRPPALILMLHGTGGNHGWAFWNYGIDGGRFRPDDIVVSPDGVTPGGGDTFNFVQGKKDGAQIAEIIASFREAFPIGKVYLYGHSQGAFFCYWYGGAYPETLDGYIAHAGNVLDVAHPKLAVEKLGVAILHGRADAVVGVECAHRTHAIYEKQGYKKLKLEIVEGLNEQSGHWPLPKQVLELLDWLDRVSADDAPTARESLRHVLRAPVDLDAVADASARLGERLKGYRGEDREAITGDHAAVEAMLDAFAAAQAEVILAGKKEDDAKALSPPHLARLRRLHRALGERKAWKSALLSLGTTVEKDDKVLGKAIDELARRPGSKSVDAAEKALRTKRAGTKLLELARRIEAAIETPPKGVDEKDVASIREITAAHRETDAAVATALAEAIKAAVAELTTARPGLAPAD
ncbi:MAG: alpha/beta fold hydrolase [Planctomycetota bacterium]